VLHRDPELAQQYRRLLEPDLVRPAGWMEARRARARQPMIVESLSEARREVLEHRRWRAGRIATGMYISVNTVKTPQASTARSWR
jgi:hypothetical protein